MPWRGVLAVLLQMLFTLVIGYLMNVRGVRIAGAVLLLGIVCKLVQDEIQAPRSGVRSPTELGRTVFRIAAANLIMSLDNVVEAAGISGSDPIVMAVGLVSSVITILGFSRLILELMNRHRWIVYAGTGILAVTVPSMLLQDLKAAHRLIRTSGPVLEVPIWADWIFRGTSVGHCTTSGFWWPRRSSTIMEPA